MKVLVTGCAGFIGSHLCERLTSQGHEVLGLDNFDSYYDKDVKKANVKGLGAGFSLIEADILERETLNKIFRTHKPEYVIHEAAQAGVRASVKEPQKTNQVNVEGALNVLENVREHAVKKIVCASSSSVYGKVEYLPFDEGHPKKPISPYGVSKLAAEHYVRVYDELYGIKSACLRYFTVYGPRIRPDLAIHKFGLAALKGQELQVYGDGSKSRDFTHVSDAVDATILALKKGEGSYNVGGGSTLTVKELAEKIIREAGSGTIKYVQDQKGDVEHTKSDTTKAAKELGWKPEKDFGQGLKETIDWLRNTYRL